MIREVKWSCKLCELYDGKHIFFCCCVQCLPEECWHDNIMLRDPFFRMLAVILVSDFCWYSSVLLVVTLQHGVSVSWHCFSSAASSCWWVSGGFSRIWPLIVFFLFLWHCVLLELGGWSWTDHWTWLFINCQNWQLCILWLGLMMHPLPATTFYFIFIFKYCACGFGSWMLLLCAYTVVNHILLNVVLVEVLLKSLWVVIVVAFISIIFN